MARRRSDPNRVPIHDAPEAHAEDDHGVDTMRTPRLGDRGVL
jgi:hypothetical protein